MMKEEHATNKNHALESTFIFHLKNYLIKLKIKSVFLGFFNKII